MFWNPRETNTYYLTSISLIKKNLQDTRNTKSIPFLAWTCCFVCLLISITQTTADNSTSVPDIDFCPSISPEGLSAQPEINDVSDACCHQEDGSRRECGDLDFCFGIAISHHKSSHSNCCDEYPSCRRFEKLKSDLGHVQGLSLSDVVISVIMLIIILADSSLFVHRNIRSIKVIIFRLFFEAVQCILNVCTVILIREGQMMTTIDLLMNAACFNDVGNEANISNLNNEVQSVLIYSIAESSIGLVIVLIQVVSLYYKKRLWDPATNLEKSIVALSACIDLIECILAILSFFVFLRPAIDSFNSLYLTLGADSTAITAPCIRSCCVIASHLPKGNNSTFVPTVTPSLTPTKKVETLAPSQDFIPHIDTQLAALEAFYNATNGSHWLIPDDKRKSDWSFHNEDSSNVDVCAWHGITCDVNTGYVVEMDMDGWGKSLQGTLSTHNFKGSLPSELAQLSNLESLKVSTTDVEGTLPIEFGRLKQLNVLDLRWSNINPAIPDAIGDMTSLEKLLLRFNGRLRFEVPTTIGRLIN